MTLSMLLLASGRGTRLGGEVPKAFVACRGRSLLERSAARLRRLDPDAELVIATHPDDAALVEALRPRLAALGVGRFVAGGATRQESMARAFAAADPSSTLILVHDAARPFFPLDAARAAIARAAEVGAAVLAHRAPDTVKDVGRDGLVEATLDRDRVWLAQTPQVVRRDVLVHALELAAADGYAGTDEASLVEHAGGAVAVVASTAANMKITGPEDLALAEWHASRIDAEGEARR